MGADIMTWQATYSERFLGRAIQRPAPEPVYGYVRKTDEEIAALPEAFRPLAFIARSFGDGMAVAAGNLRITFATSTSVPSDQARPGAH